MSIKFLKPQYPYNLLFFIFVASISFRFTGLVNWMYFFGDQAWYLFSARDALLNGNLPILGITSSITWLHQGPLWTYLLIPVLAIARFNPVAASIFMIILSLAGILLAYYLGTRLKGRQSGLIYASLLGGFYFSVIHSRLAYHTSPIPWLFIITFLLFISGKFFLSGIFLGLLYQSHLLTFIYWPIFWILVWRLKLKVDYLGLFVGFLIGILPFIIAGPIQSFGIFIWVLSRLFFGIQSVGLISESYLVVLLAPACLLISLFIPHIKPKTLFGLVVVFFLANYSLLLTTNYFSSAQKSGLPFSTKSKISDEIFRLSRTTNPIITTTGPGDEFPTTKLPYTFLVWRKHFLGQSVSGHYSIFSVDEISAAVRVIE